MAKDILQSQDTTALKGMDKTVIPQVAEQLKAHGYTLHGQTLYKQNGDLLYIIAISGVFQNTREHGNFGISAGVFWRAAEEALLGTKLPAWPHVSLATARPKLTPFYMLTKSHLVLFYKNGQIDALVNALSAAIARQVIPKLQKYQTPQDLLQAPNGNGMPPNSLDKAVRYALLGDTAQASAHFAKYLQAQPQQAGRTRQVAASLGITIG